jgi:hypothetical protein
MLSCRYTELSLYRIVVMLNVAMHSVVLLYVIKQSVAMLIVITLNVIMTSVVAPKCTAGNCQDS